VPVNLYYSSSEFCPIPGGFNRIGTESDNEQENSRCVCLSGTRQFLEFARRQSKAAARKLTRARILLKASAVPLARVGRRASQRRPDIDALQYIGSVDRSSKGASMRLVAGPVPRRPRLISMETRGPTFIALACGSTPAGRVCRWTLRLLGIRLVELALSKTVSHETIRRTTQKKTVS